MSVWKCQQLQAHAREWRNQNPNTDWPNAPLTWSEILQAAGYTTYFTGKWHVNSFRPKDIFDIVGTVRPGMPNQKPKGYNRPKSKDDTEWLPWDTKQGGFWQGGTHWSEVVRDEAVDFIQEAADDENPFFMYVAFNAPHDPRQAPKEFVDLYPPESINLPASFLPEYPYAEAIGSGPKLRDEMLVPYPRTEYAIKANRAEYYALITHMDAQIGKILRALEASGQLENTYIIFTADHGLSVGHHGLIGKQNMYELSLIHI